MNSFFLLLIYWKFSTGTELILSTLYRYVPNFEEIEGADCFGPTGVYLLDFFCSGIQFNLLLSPYPCFISLLNLDLYVLGDDALIS